MYLQSSAGHIGAQTPVIIPVYTYLASGRYLFYKYRVTFLMYTIPTADMYSYICERFHEEIFLLRSSRKDVSRT